MSGEDERHDRAAELQRQLDAAPDETTARPVADALHELLDAADVDAAEQQPPRDGAHPVRATLVLEMFVLLAEYGYVRPAGASSMADSLESAP